MPTWSAATCHLPAAHLQRPHRAGGRRQLHFFHLRRQVDRYDLAQPGVAAHRRPGIAARRQRTRFVNRIGQSSSSCQFDVSAIIPICRRWRPPASVRSVIKHHVAGSDDRRTRQREPGRAGPDGGLQRQPLAKRMGPIDHKRADVRRRVAFRIRHTPCAVRHSIRHTPCAAGFGARLATFSPRRRRKSPAARHPPTPATKYQALSAPCSAARPERQPCARIARSAITNSGLSATSTVMPVASKTLTTAFPQARARPG